MKPHKAKQLVTVLIILAVAGGLAWWGSQRHIQKIEEVRNLIANSCENVAIGRLNEMAIDQDIPYLKNEFALKLKEVCDSVQTASVIEVDVKPGDVGGIGTASGQATHTAILRIGEVTLLGLRVVHPGDANKITIIGYWMPLDDDDQF